MAYGGRQEIMDAVNRALKSKKSKIDESAITKNLYLTSEPEIVISREEVRTSNFLMWQSAYSEWFFVKKLWQEFTKQDLVNILKGYNERKEGLENNNC